jgi:DNA-binding response OmpR family regulator
LKDLLQSATFPKEKLSDYYGIMLRNAQRLLGLINQFLDMRKLETGHLQLRPTKQDLVAYIKYVMASFEFQAEQKGIDFQFESPIEQLDFIFDADVLDKVLFNLISNAFKFTDANGKIKVSLLSATSELITLSVSDNGLGIPAELTDKIFEPFYQVESSAAYNTAGTGIGLSLIRELVLLHKGTIEVSSRPHIETRFTVSLGSLELDKVKAEVLPTDEGMLDTNPEVLAPLAETEAGKAMVLIVEDNLEIRQYLQLSLTAIYEVVEAVNGLEGFEKAVQIIPDFIISDIMMPEMDGIELCRKLKADERTSHIPVILLTARQSEKYQMEGLESGADDYVSKPFSTALLLLRIKNLLASRKKLRQLFDKSSGFNPRVIGVNAADKAFISKMTDLIEVNMSDAMFSVEWLGGQLNLSRTQLYRKVKALTDQTVHEYITTIRLNKAAALLLEGSLTVAEIAFHIGFSEPSNFSRSFQKQFGQTPKKFSQQGKNSPTQEKADQ